VSNYTKVSEGRFDTMAEVESAINEIIIRFGNIPGDTCTNDEWKRIDAALARVLTLVLGVK